MRVAISTKYHTAEMPCYVLNSVRTMRLEKPLYYIDKIYCHAGSDSMEEETSSISQVM